MAGEATIHSIQDCGTGPRDDREPPRKKVRKGTKSCWECKRRKVRCVFIAASETVCNECRRRDTACIGQEFPDPEPIAARLERVEAILENLVDSAGTSRIAPETPELDGGIHASSSTASAAKHTLGSSTCNSHPLSRPTTTINLDHPAPSQTSTCHDDLSHDLLAAWPNPPELDAILSLPSSSHGLLQKAAHTLSLPSAPSQMILCLPPSGSHPIHLAQKLLLLALHLLGTASHPFIRHRVLTAATRLVTTRDDLISSIPGVQCILLEAHYHDSTGHLRRAWSVTRRAITIAQLIGLHHCPRRVVDPCGEHLWFRLVQNDRYLSLMLGLPQAVVDSSPFASPAGLARCASPVERLRRMHTLAAGLILQRSSPPSPGVAVPEVIEIDRVLESASSLLPAAWWFPSTSPQDPDGDVGRLLDQISHHHLLVQLHAPFLLSSSSSTPTFPSAPPTPHHNPIMRAAHTTHSQLTALAASRSVLSLFLAFRAARPGGLDCRGVDFLAFTACAVLVLAHLQSRRDHDDVRKAEDGVFSALRHQRQGDRGLMERVLGVIDDGEEGDEVARRVVGALRALLAFEGGVEAPGLDGSVDGSVGIGGRGNSGEGEEEDGMGYGGGWGEDGKVFRIHIPWYGTVEITRGGVGREVVRLVIPGEDGRGADCAGSDPEVNARNGDEIRQDLEATANMGNGSTRYRADGNLKGFPDPDHSTGTDDWTLQGVDMAFFDNLMGGGTLWDGLMDTSDLMP